MFGNGQIDRSPGGTGTSACLAVLRARGLIDMEQRIGFESGITGGVFLGEVLGETRLGDKTAYRTTVTGTAHITGTHEFVIDPDGRLVAPVMVAMLQALETVLFVPRATLEEDDQLSSSIVVPETSDVKSTSDQETMQHVDEPKFSQKATG